VRFASVSLLTAVADFERTLIFLVKGGEGKEKKWNGIRGWGFGLKRGGASVREEWLGLDRKRGKGNYL
jgi:hypothetical protein